MGRKTRTKGKKKVSEVGSSTSKEVIISKVRNHPHVQAFMKAADSNLEMLGYTEHGSRHANYVAKHAARILRELSYPERDCELAAIAGFLHDVGNAINRSAHAQAGSLFAYQILNELGMPPDEIAVVVGAIANHDENVGDPVGPVSAAVILADKSDVHRSRVRSLREIDFDIHDRVNYAAKRSTLVVNPQKRTITLELEIDTRISQVMEYFEIFLTRMMCCQKAASTMGVEFKLTINGTKIL
jgi:hypothetical protein